MKSRVRKWGNSLAVRIPKSFAEEVRLKENVPVEMSIQDGKLVVSPMTRKSANLQHLLAGITRRNLHREIEFGAPWAMRLGNGRRLRTSAR